MKVKKIHLLGWLQPKQKLQFIDDNSLLTYFEYKLYTFITNFAQQIACSTIVFLRAKIGGFNVILRQQWLKKTRLSIDWENDYWTYCHNNDKIATS